ncbi:hypothetical protein [Celerinatantimonas sp. YJH-8]|uniref:hypothetical protein n=1 Tax=Celerinatantimonas sp. YJH-8 TaxID=3228714 RepID=UPI0038C66EED
MAILVFVVLSMLAFSLLWGANRFHRHRQTIYTCALANLLSITLCGIYTFISAGAGYLMQTPPFIHQMLTNDFNAHISIALLL